MHFDPSCLFFFFFNDTATTEIYTLSLHDALPIRDCCGRTRGRAPPRARTAPRAAAGSRRGDPPTSGRPRAKDRKSTRLNSSHLVISYAVFCLKKKKTLSELHYPRLSPAHTLSTHH